MKTSNKILVGLGALVALWFAWVGISSLIWSIRYYYWDVSPGTVFTVDGVTMNWFRIFLPVVIRLAIAAAAAWFCLELLRKRHADA